MPKFSKFALARFFDSRKKINWFKKTLIAGAIIILMFVVTYPEKFWIFLIPIFLIGIAILLKRRKRNSMFGKIRTTEKTEPWTSVQVASGPRRR